MRSHVVRIFVVLTMFIASGAVRGDVIEYDEWDDWQSAVGEFTTIDFTGFPDGTLITDQYSDLGIMFTDGNDTIYYNDGFLNDGVGLDGNLDDQISMAFDMPLFYIAADFPGDLQYYLFSDGELIYTSSTLGGSGVGFFGGLLSDVSFDEVIIVDPWGGIYIDDLHFGPPIPAPPALALLAIGCFTFRRCRRR